MARLTTPEQREAFGAALERQVRSSGIARAELAARVAEMEGRGDRPHSATQVGAWIKGENISDPIRVINIERALSDMLEAAGEERLKPGALTLRLGFLPPDAVPVMSVEEAIAADVDLDVADRSYLLSAYRHAAQRGRQDSV